MNYIEWKQLNENSFYFNSIYSNDQCSIHIHYNWMGKMFRLKYSQFYSAITIYERKLNAEPKRCFKSINQNNRVEILFNPLNRYLICLLWLTISHYVEEWKEDPKDNCNAIRLWAKVVEIIYRRSNSWGGRRECRRGARICAIPNDPAAYPRNHAATDLARMS